jgi:PAS domain S-box-containing protein
LRRPIQTLRAIVLAAAPGLEAAEALFDALADVLFCVKDRERRYVAANDAFIRAAGLRARAALLGRTAREVFPEILAAGYEQQDDEVFGKGSTLHDRIEMVTRSDGGIGWFVSQKVPVRDRHGNVIALAGISRDLAIPAQESELDPLARALDTLHRDFAKPLRIDKLARSAGLSYSQFERRVRALTGLTPRQLLIKARVEAAAHDLRDTQLSAGAIASRCGFYDQAAFTRQFRAATGLAPGQYRTALKAAR